MAKRSTGQVPAGGQPLDNPEETPLSYKEERFVEFYLQNGHNATRAYLEAYRTGYGTANVEGPRLLVRPRIAAAIEAERERLRNIGKFSREQAIQILLAIATTTPDRVTSALRAPSQENSYVGLGDARYAIHVQKTPEGYVASTPSLGERRAAINDLWEKLGLDKNASESDRVSFLERLASMGQRLGRGSDKPGPASGGEGPGPT